MTLIHQLMMLEHKLLEKNEHNETNEDLDRTTEKLNKSHSGVQFRASYIYIYIYEGKKFL